MLYRAIGLMSGSSLDGLDLVFVELLENSGNWSFEIKAAECYGYSKEWEARLRNAASLDALNYQLLHADYGHFLGRQVNRFIEEKGIHFQVALIASHGHTAFHLPSKKMTAQLGDGAAIAAETGLPVVCDLRALDVALGGQGAPIVPIGEKLLFPGYPMLLNLGGIANISFRLDDRYTAFDVCPANRVLNMIAALAQKEYDDNGEMASNGNVNEELLAQLNALDYYQQTFPKSLPNEFGTDHIFPLIRSFGLSNNDALRTCVQHIADQIKKAVQDNYRASEITQQVLVTGGGAFNHFLVERINEALSPMNCKLVIPEENIVSYKEALIMALIGVLRWRQEYTTMSSVTGAERDSIGGAVWIGQDA